MEERDVKQSTIKKKMAVLPKLFLIFWLTNDEEVV